MTSLMVCCRDNKYILAERLLLRDCCVNLKDNSGNNALFYALNGFHNSSYILNLLINSNKIDLESTNSLNVS